MERYMTTKTSGKKEAKTITLITPAADPRIAELEKEVQRLTNLNKSFDADNARKADLITGLHNEISHYRKKAENAEAAAEAAKQQVENIMAVIKAVSGQGNKFDSRRPWLGPY
jgi:hypothetical protein